MSISVAVPVIMMVVKLWTREVLVQTAQTLIRLLLRSCLIRVCTVCHHSRIHLNHYCIVKSMFSNFRIISVIG